MNGIKKMVTSEFVVSVVLSLLNWSGLTRPVAPPAPIQVVVVVIGKAEIPDIQATIYSADWCIPCRPYVKSVKEKMPADGWIVKDATDKDSATAHVIISKDESQFEKLKIKCIPCTIIRRKGKEKRRFNHRLTPDQLADEINNVAKMKD